MLQALEHDDAAAIAEHEPVAIQVEGRLAVSGESLRVDSAFMLGRPRP